LNSHDKRIFGTLFFSIFATLTGVGIVVPLLPVYARQLGAGGFAIGLIFGAFSISRTFLIPFFGRLSDRKGRKPVIVPGMLAYAVVSLAFMESSSVTALIVIRFLQGIASAALMPVIQAYVGDISPPGREGATMGFFNLSLFCGLSLGPLVGGGIRDHFGIQATFASMALLAFVGFGLTALLLPPARTERIVRTSQALGPWQDLLRDWPLWELFLFRIAYTFGIGIIWSFLPVIADAEFALSGTAIGAIVTLGVLVSGLLQAPMGLLADRLDKRRMVALGGLVVAGAMLSFGWVQGFSGLLIANLFFGLGGGISMPALTALAVQKGSRLSLMGTVMAVLTVGHSAGMLAGSLLGGVMMDLVGLRTVFALGAVVVASATILFWRRSRG
jgi:MFS family permease